MPEGVTRRYCGWLQYVLGKVFFPKGGRAFPYASCRRMLLLDADVQLAKERFVTFCNPRKE